MSPGSARTMVLLAAGLMFAAIGLRRQQIGDPFKYAWAAGVITLFLSLLADLVPEIAGPAAVLVLMAVYWRNRGVIGGRTALGSVIQQGSGGPAPASSSSSSPSGGGTT